MTKREVTPYIYSGALTSPLVSEGVSEIGSFSILPEDTQGRDKIYGLVRKILRYVSGDVTLINTFNTEGESRLLGTIIQYSDQ